eukprot:TRINITY_DN266_c0_g1_i2.p1 TRINITY_DN266_c0_g1~~TRINITY_DN266_c0_g1_i2.p1  ORF type:complete len:253 (-),score=59.39 TRINITY_DN266_c0_g1_i2:170-847(-)
MSFRGVYWTLCIIFLLGMAALDIAWITQMNPKLDGLGTKNDRITAKVITTVSTIFQAVMIVVICTELIIRGYLSAFGFPCSFQRREICCLEYKMTTFWKALKIISAVAFPVMVLIAALMIFLDIGTAKISPAKFANSTPFNLIHTAIMVGVPLLQVILSSIGHYLSKQEYFEQYPEELPMAGDGSDEESGSQSSPMNSFPMQESMQAASGNGKVPERPRAPTASA